MIPSYVRWYEVQTEQQSFLEMFPSLTINLLLLQ